MALAEQAVVADDPAAEVLASETASVDPASEVAEEAAAVLAEVAPVEETPAPVKEKSWWEGWFE